MRSSAPRLCAFIRSRARSSRYFRSRSQFTRSCQSTPTVPKFAMAVLSSDRRISAAGFISAAPPACQTQMKARPADPSTERLSSLR
ncbi:MAG: hypothetical protein DME03_15465 [Candidatus Rokuibacteriota bacterium]|nr:MAG: hypothetical protein DME03_15465 [Candidatus Rokubacteria bacterium]